MPRKSSQPSPGDDQLSATFDRTVEEGAFRLERTLPGLLATGAVGGVDVSMGVLALLLVEAEHVSPLLAALAFGIGFVALTLAGSELFTENFLVPIAAVVAKRARARRVVRLWVGTGLTNLAAGWLAMALVMAALPRLGVTAVHVAVEYQRAGITGQSFAAAVLGGAVMTLMTWLERSTESEPAKLVAAFSAAFLLAAGPLNHVIVSSLEMFAAFQHGAPFGYLDWLGLAAWYALGNAIGGVGLVSALRLVQVGRARIEAEQR